VEGGALIATGTVKRFNDAKSRHDLCYVCGERTGATAVDDTDGWRWFNDGKGGLLPLCATCAVPYDLLESIPPGTSGATKPDSPGRDTSRV
jgi:hypothetical protein